MCWVGIDIGQASLHVAASVPVPVATLPRRVSNTAAGITPLVTALTGLAPTLVVCEATGVYYRPLLAALVTAGLPVAGVNPAQVAAFRQARLGREKSDHADARLLARFAEVDAATDQLLADLTEAPVLRELPGVGPRVAAAVVAYLPRALWGDAKAAAAYAGVHPRRTQSGQRDTSQLSKQGPPGCAATCLWPRPSRSGTPPTWPRSTPACSSGARPRVVPSAPSCTNSCAG